MRRHAIATDDVDPRIERAHEAFNDHDLDAMIAEFAEGGTFVDPLVEEGVAGDEFREYCDDVFRAFPDVRLDPDQFLTDDAGAAIVGTYRGTHEGPIEGVPPTGRTVSVPAVAVVAVSDDGITSWRDYWNEETFAEQLGLTFPSIVPLLPRMLVGKVREAH